MATTRVETRPGARAAERPRAAEARRRRRRWVKPVLLWVAVVLIWLFCLFPFYWLLNVSLKTGADLSQADLLPPSPSLDNYSSILENSDFTSALRNSVIVTAITTALALIVGSFAAYALARLRFPRKFLILAVILSISTFPPIAIAAPIFKLWTDIGALQHLRRPYHPVPDVRPAALHLHPCLVLQGDPQGARGGGASTAPRISRRSARSWCRWQRRGSSPPACSPPSSSGTNSCWR
jgi:hypothetical protein